MYLTKKMATKGEKQVIKRVVRRVVRKVPEPKSEPAPEPAPEPVPEPELEPVISPTPADEETIVTPGGTRKVREVTPETIDSDFEELCNTIQDEISRQREDKQTERTVIATNLKHLRAILKTVRQLKGDTRRISRKKRPRATGGISGFTKETPITDEMADFLGLKRGTKIARSVVSGKLNAYVRENKLQNPEKGKGREIFPDAKLAKLLRYDKKVHGQMRYCTITKLMQQHFL